MALLDNLDSFSMVLRVWMGWLQNHVFDLSNSTFYQDIELEEKYGRVTKHPGGLVKDKHQTI